MSNITTLEQHFTRRYGEIGTPTRDEFEKKSKAFAVGELIKDAREQAKMTQTELAEKSGTKKAYISRIENGQTDIQLATLYRIIEIGLGKQLTLTIK